MAVTNSFLEAVKSNNLTGVRIMMKDSLLLDPTFPDTLTTIKANAFRGCANLELVEIPDSVTHITGNPFSNCPKLRIKCSPNSAAAKMADEYGIKH